MFIEVDEKYVKARVVVQAAEILRKGGVIIYPTDTVYAYACDIRCKSAIEKIYSIKKIDRKKPLSFVFSDISMMSSYVKNMPDAAFKVMRKVLPGPYTFIFNASKLLPDIVLTKQKTIGVRIPDSLYALEIVKELGVPFLSAGLDVDEGEFETDPRNLPKHIINQVDIILDCGSKRAEISTMVDFSGDEAVVLREGKGSTDFIHGAY